MKTAPHSRGTSVCGALTEYFDKLVFIVNGRIYTKIAVSVRKRSPSGRAWRKASAIKPSTRILEKARARRTITRKVSSTNKTYETT